MTEKIICNAEDLVAIADAVRASTGSAVNYNVPELSVAAVDAIGSGGGEDVTAETETYTDLLTNLEAAIDELPDAGAGGGVETCTVTVTDDYNANWTFCYTSYENGSFVNIDFVSDDSTARVLSVVKGTNLFVWTNGVTSGYALEGSVSFEKSIFASNAGQLITFNAAGDGTIILE